MHVVIAPDTFKGTLAADRVAAALADGLRRSDPTLRVTCVPIADGGEGTLEVALADGWVSRQVTARGPLGQPGPAAIALSTTDDGVPTALVELAAASGLARLPKGPGGQPQPDALTASSFGTGELIRAALDHGARRILLGIGGSACTDGGAGLLQALGARLTDAAGRDVGPGGAALLTLAAVDPSALDGRVAQTEFVVACDVDNPLLGPRGAAAVFAPQKGADAAQVAVLERALTRWRDALTDVLGPSARAAADRPGSGAAGGVGYAAMTVLGATPRPGIELVLDLVNLSSTVATADLVITGEGSLDAQSLAGKAPVGVLAVARRHGVPTLAVCGRCTLSPEQVRAAGFVGVRALADRDPRRCLTDPDGMLRELGAELARDRTLIRPG